MNHERHVDAFREYFAHLAADEDDEGRRRSRDFYEEYMAVADLSADFYLETVGWCSRSTRCRSAS